MLEIVAEALTFNGIKLVHCKNRQKDFESQGAVNLFRSSAEVHVLLLPLAFGAEGLDLVVASHIFLLEPLMNPQQERQAINRIYRIGQTRRTMIHKYVIKGSVEEVITSLQREWSEGLDEADAASLPAARGLKRDDGHLTLNTIMRIFDCPLV